MSKIPGYISIAEFAKVWGLAPDTVRNQLKRGCCAWPQLKMKTGSRKHPLYATWDNLKQRCLNKNNPAYKDYGGRGITVCNTWRTDFWKFAKDMGERPDESYTLDRIDNDLGYFKENCRWASKSQQALNRRMRCDNVSGVVGVSFDPANTRWRFNRMVNGRIIYKYFKTKEEAIKFKEQFNDNTLTDSK